MRVATVLLGAVLLTAGAPAFQDQGDQDEAIVLVWHKLAKVPLDTRGTAERNEAVRRASQFDRPEVLAAEEARLNSLLDAADPSREFTLQVNDNVSQYDHEQGRFAITLYQAGYYVTVEAFGQQYSVVFANAESGRYIPMPKEEARVFDERLNRMGRRVTNDLRFRVIGAGDPAGAVSGDRVIRAELVSARLLDANDQVVWTPTLTAHSAVAATGATPTFDPALADVAGLRVGGPGADLEATLTRLYGEVVRGGVGEGAPPGTVATLDVNSMGCLVITGRRNNGRPGSTCITAWLDASETVRMIRIERVFPWVDQGFLRQALVRKYGEVAQTWRGGGHWGWGPEQPGGQLVGRGVALRAVNANWRTNDPDLFGGNNSRPQVNITLTLVDTNWPGGK
ncbi:MAG: DUF4852 domain-containing protein [Gemmatimonadota bacterium]